jgi:hypothetical protein
VAQRGFSGVGRRGLGELETAESTVGKVWQRRAPVPTACSGGRGGAGCVAVRGRAPFLRQPAHPLGTGGRVEAEPGDAHAGRRKRTAGPWRVVRRLGTRGVPGVRGIGRRVAAMGRRGLPREHALAGPDAEAAASRGGARARRARRAGRRDVAARPRTALPVSI